DLDLHRCADLRDPRSEAAGGRLRGGPGAEEHLAVESLGPDRPSVGARRHRNRLDHADTPYATRTRAVPTTLLRLLYAPPATVLQQCGDGESPSTRRSSAGLGGGKLVRLAARGGDHQADQLFGHLRLQPLGMSLVE